MIYIHTATQKQKVKDFRDYRNHSAPGSVLRNAQAFQAQISELTRSERLVLRHTIKDLTNYAKLLRLMYLDASNGELTHPPKPGPDLTELSDTPLEHIKIEAEEKEGGAHDAG